MKNLSSLGKVLNIAQQKTINGGAKGRCDLQCTWRLDPIACKCIPRGI